MSRIGRPCLFAAASLLSFATPALAVERGSAPMGVATYQAADEGPSGFEVGVRLGYQMPSGKIGDITSSRGINFDQDTKLGDVVWSGMNLVLDVGHRVNRTVYYGLALAYTPSLDPKNCPSGCSFSDMRVGASLVIHPRVAAVPKLDPFIGFGVNYDQLTLSGPSGVTGEKLSFTFYGMEFLNVMLGANFLVLPQLSVGGYFSGSLGMYFGADNSNTHHPELHEWYTLGIRGSYTL
jgi:hypothetical protein